MDSDTPTIDLPKKNKMYYVLAYDIASEKRIVKALKICRKYLNWVQNSVFEGELTEGQYKRLISELKRIIEKDEDSVITYCLNDRRYLLKTVTGIEKNAVTNFI